MIEKSQVSLPEGAGRSVLRIALPVSFEFILVLGLAFVTQIIVGGLGDVAVAAVGFATSINTIPLFFLGALHIGAGIVVARAYGAGLRTRIDSTVTFSVIATLGLSVLVSIPFVLFPESILQWAGASAGVIQEGSGFLAITLAGLFAGVLSMVLGGILRSANRARSPLIATIVMVAVNIPLSVILVYGWGPIEAMGVVGAAVAAVVTGIVRAAVLLAHTFLIHDVADWAPPGRWSVFWETGKPVLVLAFPMALTSLSWTFGNFFYTILVQQLGDAALAALQIVLALSAVFVVGSLGLCSAATVLAGHAVGQREPERAREWVNFVLRWGVVTGIFFGILFAASSIFVSQLFPNLSEDALAATVTGILILAIAQPFSVRMLIWASVLPAGNDTSAVIIGDLAGPYLGGLPLTLFLGFFTPLGVLAAFFGKAAEEIIKWLVFSFRGKRIRWDRVVDRHTESVIAEGDARTGPIPAVYLTEDP